jgi:hypothetical protein
MQRRREPPDCALGGHTAPAARANPLKICSCNRFNDVRQYLCGVSPVWKLTPPYARERRAWPARAALR